MLPLWADLAPTLVFGLSGALLAGQSSLDLVGRDPCRWEVPHLRA